MDTIIRATVAYWILLATLRLLGRRSVSQQSPFELLVLFILGGITIQVIVADDRSLINAVTAVFTIATNHLLVSAFKQRHEGFRKLVDGTPIIVVTDGKVDERILSGLRMVDEDVMAAAREKGARDIDEVELAVVERDGNITIFRR
jgi:uncharacterized membrane protein YcaP (DUF421 family)